MDSADSQLKSDQIFGMNHIELQGSFAAVLRERIKYSYYVIYKEAVDVKKMLYLRGSPRTLDLLKVRRAGRGCYVYLFLKVLSVYESRTLKS